MTSNINIQELPYLYEKDLIGQMVSVGKPVMSIYPFSGNALVLGKGSRMSDEIHMGQALVDGIRIYRRMGGGCSVFLDPGNLIVSAAYPAKGILGIKELFHRGNTWLIQGLKDSGVKGITQDGISDLVIDGFKIAGTSFYRAKGVAYYTAAVLVSPDTDLMERYLKHPPREPDYRKGRTHKDFVKGLSAFDPDVTSGKLISNLRNHLNPLDLLCLM